MPHPVSLPINYLANHSSSVSMIETSFELMNLFRQVLGNNNGEFTVIHFYVRILRLLFRLIAS